MIENDAQLDQTLTEIARMYRALAALRRDVQPQSSEWFALLAEGPLDEIARMEADVARYCGRTDAELALRLTSSRDG